MAAFAVSPVTDIARMWADARPGQSPRLLLNTDSHNIEVAGLQIWDGGGTARQVYQSLVPNESTPYDLRTEISSVGTQGDRVFIALHGSPGDRPTTGGSWIESAMNPDSTTDWTVETTVSPSWDTLIRGFAFFDSGNIAAYGTNGYYNPCGSTGVAPWVALRGANGTWTSGNLPVTFCGEIVLAGVVASDGRSLDLVTQSGVLEGLPGTQEWHRLLSFHTGGGAAFGEARKNMAILEMADGSLARWSPGDADAKTIAPRAPEAGAIPGASQAGWFNGRGGWDTNGTQAAWVTSSYVKRKHCHPPLMIFPIWDGGPYQDPCTDLVSVVWRWDGQTWKRAASEYGYLSPAVAITDEGRIYVPETGQVLTTQ
ncbi:MAG TPA: hypothetical protein VL588_05460 [Bdellovibrionota bacterium]|nr:hypothetical protein [Bdellovibrionota bacterium]